MLPTNERSTNRRAVSGGGRILPENNGEDGKDRTKGTRVGGLTSRIGGLTSRKTRQAVHRGAMRQVRKVSSNAQAATSI